jgi:phage terminase Nu1 subunit (DNA packaging protein)
VSRAGLEPADSSLRIGEWRLRREAAEREGELLRKDDVQEAAHDMIMTIRETLMGIPAQLQDRLAGLSSAPACGELLEEEIRHALTKLSEYPPKKPKAPARRRKARSK